MTLDYERFWALRNVRQYLERIILGEEQFPKSKKASIEKAYRLLKHYPEPKFIDEMEQKMKQIFEEAKR